MKISLGRTDDSINGRSVLPSIPSPPRPTKGPVARPIRSVKRLAALIGGHQRRRQAADERRKQVHIVEPKRSPALCEVLDPCNLPSRKTLGRPLGSKNFAFDYPPCPHCESSAVKRAGFARGIQRYRCLSCARSFSGARILIEDHREKWDLMCYRCGSYSARNLGASPNSGRIGFCHKCHRRFTQGGRSELEVHHLLLEKRVADLGLPKDVSEELLQQAYRDVIEGRGYCWTVLLDVRRAFRSSRGEWGRGSDHPAFREQQGQNPHDAFS